MFRFPRIIRRYFSFSRGEQRGAIILLGLIMAVNLVRYTLPGTYRMDASSFASLLGLLKQMQRSPTTSQEERMSTDGAPQSVRFTIELNRADTLDLQRIPGIGPSFARRITGYRDKLGGFVTVTQLLEVYGMDSVRFRGIRKYVTADTTCVRRMNINTVTFKELIAHPYMPFELAKEIEVYRKRHRRIREMDELWSMKGIDSVAMGRLRSYVRFE